jgi:hypothetical protein
MPIAEMSKEMGETVLPENIPVDPQHIIHLRKGLKKEQVREGAF